MRTAVVAGPGNRLRAGLDRLRGASGPEAVFRTIPGVGAALALRLHDELGVETLDDAEDIKDVPDAILSEALQITADLAQIEPRYVARVRPAS